MSKKQPVMSHDPLADLPASDVQDDVAPASSQDDRGLVVLPATITIADLGGLHAAFAAKLAQGGPLQLDGGEVETIDGAGVQLLAALFKAGREKGFAIEWSATSEKVIQAARQLGLSAHMQLNDAGLGDGA